jgi:glucosamine-6-phosphate deaminase
VEICIVSGEELAAVGAGIVAEAMASARRSAPTLMPALGESALGVYRELGRRRQAGELGTEHWRLVQLDEYLGVDEADPRALIGWLRRDVARPLGVADDAIVRLPGDATDPGAACRAYDAAVDAAGGIDVAVLGLGPNGHLGFNEPPSPADEPTRVVELAAASLESNARYWPGLAVPAWALTAGMPAILAARRVLLVVTGAHKRSIVRRLLEGPIGPELPASFLRSHGAATLLIDEAAWPPELAAP